MLNILKQKKDTIFKILFLYPLKFFKEKSSRFPNLNSIYDILIYSNFWDLIRFQVERLVFNFKKHAVVQKLFFF